MLGRSGGVSLHHLERIIELLPDFEEAFIVVEGEGALRFKNTLFGALGAGAEDAEEGDDEDEDDDFDEDEESDELESDEGEDD